MSTSRLNMFGTDQIGRKNFGEASSGVHEGENQTGGGKGKGRVCPSRAFEELRKNELQGTPYAYGWGFPSLGLGAVRKLGNVGEGGGCSLPFRNEKVENGLS